MSASPLPNGRVQFVDQNGAPLVGGSVSFYVPGTSAPKRTWADPAMVGVNPPSITLDSIGAATVWGIGSYRQVVRDINGALIWDVVTQVIPYVNASADALDAAVNTVLEQVGELTGYAGTGQVFDVTAYVPGDVLELPFTVAQSWLARVQRNGVLQVPGDDYTISGSLLTFMTPYLVGETFNVINTGGESVSAAASLAAGYSLPISSALQAHRDFLVNFWDSTSTNVIAHPRIRPTDGMSSVTWGLVNNSFFAPSWWQMVNGLKVMYDAWRLAKDRNDPAAEAIRARISVQADYLSQVYAPVVTFQGYIGGGANNVLYALGGFSPPAGTIRPGTQAVLSGPGVTANTKIIPTSGDDPNSFPYQAANYTIDTPQTVGSAGSPITMTLTYPVTHYGIGGDGTADSTVYSADDAAWKLMGLRLLHEVTGNQVWLDALQSAINNIFVVFADPYGHNVTLPTFTYPEYGLCYQTPAHDTTNDGSNYSSHYDAFTLLSLIYAWEQTDNPDYLTCANAFVSNLLRLQMSSGVLWGQLIINPAGHLGQPFLSHGVSLSGPQQLGWTSYGMTGTVALAVALARLFRITGADTYRASAAQIVAGLITPFNVDVMSAGTSGFLTAGSYAATSGTFFPWTDPWEDGIAFADLAREVLSLPGVDPTGICAQAIKATAASIALQRYVNVTLNGVTYTGVYPADWAGALNAPATQGLITGYTSYAAEYAAHEGNQAGASQIMTTSAASNVIIAGAILAQPVSVPQ